MLYGCNLRVVSNLCLILVLRSTLTDAAGINPVHGENIEPLVAITTDQSRVQRRDVISEEERNIPPWLGNLQGGRLKYTRYSNEENGERREVISKPTVVAEKRTIKIGNHVCGSVDDANEFERTWKRKKANSSVSSVKEVHKCCWRHNRCPRTVPAKVARYGFKNDMEYDIMSCGCDNVFKKCLKDGKSYTADAIGHLYFDTLKIPCLTFTAAQNRHEADYVSVVPDLVVEHPRIGAAKVAVNLDTKRSKAREDNTNEGITHALPYKKSSTSLVSGAEVRRQPPLQRSFFKTPMNASMFSIM